MTTHNPTGTVPPIDSAANVTGLDVIGNKADTTAGTSLVALNKQALLYSEHIPLFSGEIWYVSPAGDNANSGDNPHEPFLTIGHAVTTAAAGDAIVTVAGTYAEAVDLSKNSLEFWPEIGTIIAPAAGVPLTVSGNYCKVWLPGGALRLNPPAGGTGCLISGSWCYVHNVRVPAGSSALYGYDVTGAGCVLTDCRCSSPLTAAFRIQASMVKVEDCCTGGTPGDSSIGFHVTNSVDRVRIVNCDSSGHETAGFQIDAGVTNVVVDRQCVSGAGDGHYIDLGTDSFLGLEEHDSSEHHEHTYPMPDGEGTAGDSVTVQSEINDETGLDITKDYWGDVALLVDTTGITTGWYFKGVNFFGTTINDDQRFAFYRTVYATLAVRNAGNNWDEGATVLTVNDASGFAVNDLVWVRSTGYVAAGEIVKVTNIAGNVVTIARQTENSGRTGLHWDHTTHDPGGEEMYLCWRDENQYHSSDMDYSSQTARSFSHQPFVEQRRMHENDGVICRMINGTDGANSLCDVTIIWAD